VRDPFEKNVPGLGLGRDGCRTPMQWDASRFAGFSLVEPWLPITKDAAQRNVASARADPGSLYNLYRRLIALRRKHPALATGGYRPFMTEGQVLAYVREHAADRFLVALNLGAAPASVPLPEGQGTVALSVVGDRCGERVRERLNLVGNDGVLIKLD